MILKLEESQADETHNRLVLVLQQANKQTNKQTQDAGSLIWFIMVSSSLLNADGKGTLDEWYWLCYYCCRAVLIGNCDHSWNC